ncbi:hypothetical protein [Bacillus sp. FJAT-27264]|uniref:DUF6906 family protein n=1 Tax=Paenibacillus sp. (strain DSM 101736 / FJAT-27264) TaxID=1850362 RepID=UPI001586F8A7|nr:hypothetical protein [Bacillus sp. FJAT-27264]
MKQGRRPNRRQMKIIQEKRLNPSNWFVERDNPSEMVIVHRQSGSAKSIQKAGLSI